jgi:helitron helicase-like protein
VADVEPGTVPSRDLRLTLHAPPEGGSALRRVSLCHPSYLPLHYVLLFPHGDPGWHPGLIQPNDDDPPRLSLRQYHAYRMFTRHGEFNTLFRARRLFQQYLVDAAATIDQNRLAWVYNNQRKIRADLYSGLDDALAATDVDGDRRAPGRRIILPSSHTGIQRNMRAAYMDAMAITGRFRKPHLFLTMTANPSWAEVRQAMLSADQSSRISSLGCFT